MEAKDGAFHVRTGTQQYVAATVLLAIGRRGTPRKLGVPGEELPKVVYRLIDPEQYRGQKVMVVGGGDSALEAAASIAELGDTAVVPCPIAARRFSAPSSATASASMRRAPRASSRYCSIRRSAKFEPRT